MEVDMNRSVLALIVGVSATLACSGNVDPGGPLGSSPSALRKDVPSAPIEGLADSGKGDGGAPGCGTQAGGGSDKEASDGGSASSEDGGSASTDDGGSDSGSDGGTSACFDVVVDGCMPVKDAVQLPYIKCSPELDVVWVGPGDSCGPESVNGVKFTCCQPESAPKPTCETLTIPQGICKDWTAVKTYAQKCPSAVSFPADPCAEGAVIECCDAPAAPPPVQK
jgi:hypothetical protein